MREYPKENNYISSELNKFGLYKVKKLMNEIELKAKSMGCNIVIAVVDDKGNLIALHFMDGALPISLDVAMKKAYTAAVLKMTTEELSEIAQPGEPLYGITDANEKIIIFGGGVPLVEENKTVGAVGISGGTVKEDIEIANFALKIYREMDHMKINQVNIENIVKQILTELKDESEPSVCSKTTDFLVPETAKAAVLTDIQKIEVRKFKIPEIKDDEMLVKVEGCGICGTDVHEYKKDPFALIPVVLGHEGTGKIVKMGKNIKKDSSGKAVNVGDSIVTCIIPCGECDICLNHPERTNLCENAGIYGLTPDDEYHLNGWFSEYLVIRKGSTFFNVTDMDLDERLLIEPAAVVVHAVERAKSTGLLKFNSKVLVQGCGPIGLLLISVVRTLGIENIIALDGNEDRLAMAKKLGANKIINFTKYDGLNEIIKAVHEVSEGLGVDFAFQCTGVPAAAANIWKYVKRGGGLCEVGFFVDNGDCKINPHFDICNKEITAVGTWTYTPQDYLTTFDFLKRAKGIGLPIKQLITHRFPLDEMNKAMEVNMKQEGIKIVYINDKF